MHIPRTPPEVLEECRKTTSEAVKRIKQGEKLFTEVVEAISTMWEFIIEDEAMDKIKEDACQIDLNIRAVKEDMKNLSIKEKIAKVTELKHLQ